MYTRIYEYYFYMHRFFEKTLQKPGIVFIPVTQDYAGEPLSSPSIICPSLELEKFSRSVFVPPPST